MAQNDSPINKSPYPEIQKDIEEKQKQLYQSLNQTYLPHYNIYQRMFLKNKINCHEKFQQNPEQYYICVDEFDRKQNQNSKALQSKFGQIDVEYDDCMDKCRQSFIQIQDQFDNCVQKCFKKQKQSAFEVYDQFYQQNISKESDYTKLK